MLQYSNEKQRHAMRLLNSISVIFLTLFVGAIQRAYCATPPPAIFYSDLDAGPSSGGEANGGAFVTIYGNNFGASGTVSVGGANATVYKLWGAKWLWYQKIAFQIPPTAAQGPTTITVTNVNGKSNSLPFTIRSGKIYFVATNGSDANSGASGQPFQSIAKCRDSLAPGDICYVRNGVSQTSDDYNAGLVLGSPGTSNAFKSLIVYPGESATVGTDSGDRGIYPCSGYSGCPGDGGSYWLVAGFNIRGPEALYIASVHDLKFVANNIQCPTGDGSTACVETSYSDNFRLYGNEVSNVGVANPSKLYHAMYFSTNTNSVDIGWGSVHDSRGCRGIQFHSTSGNNQFGLLVHDNLIYNIRCDGINFNTVDPSKGTVAAYNNVIYNAGYGGGAFPEGDSNYSCIFVPADTNAGPTGSGTVEIYNNTLYHCGSHGGVDSGAIITGTDGSVHVRLRNNIVYQDSGTTAPYLGTHTLFNFLSGSNNIWFGKGSGPSQTTGNVAADPKFSNVGGSDFHLQSGSPAIDGGVSIAGLVRDRDGTPRPQGNSFDIGAYEYYQGAQASKPSCDLNSDGVVNASDVQIALAQALGQTACGSADLEQSGTCTVVGVQRVVNASLGQACRVGP